MTNTLYAWTATVTDLIAAQVVVRQHCRCPSRDMPLHEIRDHMGPRFSFWNRHPVCPVCETPAWFGASPVKGLFWTVHMREGPADEVARLHAAWRAGGLPRRPPPKPLP